MNSSNTYIAKLFHALLKYLLLVPTEELLVLWGPSDPKVIHRGQEQGLGYCHHGYRTVTVVLPTAWDSLMPGCAQAQGGNPTTHLLTTEESPGPDWAVLLLEGLRGHSHSSPTPNNPFPWHSFEGNYPAAPAIPHAEHFSL